MTVLLALVAGFAGARLWLGADRQEMALARGAEALHRALHGDEEAWDEAREAYRRAARDTLVDPYPLFALEITRELRSGEPEAATGSATAVLLALVEGRLEAARTRLEEVEPGRGRDLLERLLDDLLRAHSDSRPE
ncbi:MAG: hypothetical protein ACQEXJ_07290 [Myxococcota bacterium]